MATISGYKGLVQVGGTPSTIAQVSQWSFDRSADTQKVQWLGSADKSTVATTVDTTISVEGFYDASDTNGQVTLAADSAVGSSFSLLLFPETATLNTATSGDEYFGGTVVLTQFSITSSSEDVVKFTASFEGALTSQSVT